MRGWVGQTKRHPVRHSKVACRLKIGTYNRGSRRKVVRIRRIHRDTPGRISRPDTTLYNTKRFGGIQKKSSRGIALYPVLM